MRRYIYALLNQKASTGTDQRSELFKALTIGFRCSIDIQMIRISRSDDSHIGTKPMEGTVEFVSLENGKIALVRKHQIALIVTNDATQKGIAVHMRVLQQMGKHRRGRCLAVRTGDAEATHRIGNDTKHLSALHHLEAMSNKVSQFSLIGWNCCRIDDKCIFRVLESFRNQIHIDSIMDVSALLFQSFRELRRRAVISGHLDSL